MRKVIDAKFEVVSGPMPVRWQPRPEKARTPWFKIAYAALIALVAGYTLLLGLAGADLDTRDAVAADEARQPVAAELR
jgi:hypothetical protein